MFRSAAVLALAGLLSCSAVAADLNLPVNKKLLGRWVSSDATEHGRLEASLVPVGDEEGEYELSFKVTGSPIFNAEGKPYPDEGVYPLRLERLGDDGLAFTYRQPYPRVKALFFVPGSLTYRVRLEGNVTTAASGSWNAMVNDHNLALTLWVRPGAIAGTYDYDGRWASAAGSFRMVAYPQERSGPSRRRSDRGDATPPVAIESSAIDSLPESGRGAAPGGSPETVAGQSGRSPGDRSWDSAGRLPGG